MKKIVIAAVLGVVVATAVPALAQSDTPAVSPSTGCAHETGMNSQAMDQWMSSAGHDQWMSSAGHSQMAGRDGHMTGGSMMGA